MTIDKISLNRFSTIPLHKQLSNNIHDQITRGILKPGEILPSVIEMKSLTGVSSVVIRQAYEYLRRAGLVVTQQGKGTFVAESKQSFEFIQKLGSSFEEAKAKREKVTTTVIELKEVFEFNTNIKHKLKLSKNDHIIMITRLRSIRNIKMFFWTSYLPASICKPLLEEDFTKVSLYQVLEEKLNLKILRAERFVEVVKADFQKAEILNIPELEPLFFIESIAYTKDNLPVEYYQGWYDTNYTKFYFEIK